jgi:ABC-type lipoprotein export system ATPase subunit
MIKKITLLGGLSKDKKPEPVRSVELRMGNIISIVGPTGSGKTTLISDLEFFAASDTPSGRRVLINGKPAPQKYRDNPHLNPVARITQHTNFLSDLPVKEFLSIHASIRHSSGESAQVVERTLAFADQLTGEPVPPGCRMTELSGGQTRALLIADAAVISDTPIVLLDEIENAGIDRMRALELLRAREKIYIFVTHDPYIALLSDFRIVMKNGSMEKIIKTDPEERRLCERVGKIDALLSGLRDKIRAGSRLNLQEVLP